MANPVKGETPLVLADGREFLLVLDHEALLSIEQSYGKPLPVVMHEAGEGFLSAVAAIAQAGFARHHPEVSRGDIVKMVMSGDRDALSAALTEASVRAFPDLDDLGNASDPEPKRRAGKRSGRSGAKRG